MQSRRDQLQAYRFQNRRALAALVTGEPNVLEPPMRRLTVTTLSGIMIAILIAAGFAALGIIHPSAGDSWKNSHAVIIDRDNGSTYVYLDKKLHPTVNYTSAVLAVSGTQSGSTGGAVTRVEVSPGDISGATYGSEIGIPDVPSALPSAGSLRNFPMAVCSTQQKGQVSTSPSIRVSLRIDDHASTGELVQASHGLVVETSHGSPYLLTGGRRLEITSRNIASKLGFGQPVVVGTSFLDSIPTGPRLAPPAIPDLGAPGSHRVGSAQPAIGTIVNTTGADESFIMLSGGLQQLTPFEAALFADSTRNLQVASSVTDSAEKVDPQTPNPVSDLGRTLPPRIPVNDDASAEQTGVCAVYHSAARSPQFTLDPDSAASVPGNRPPHEGDTSLSGRADTVSVPPLKGVLARSADNPHSAVEIISDQGVRYSFDNVGLLASFGYSTKDITRVPAALLTLIPASTTALSVTAAKRTVPR